MDYPWGYKASAVRNWALGDFNRVWVLEYLIPFKTVRVIENGKKLKQIRPKNTHGVAKAGGRKFRYIFAENGKLATDLPPYGDKKTHSPRCPFLLPENDEGQNLCGLYDTDHHYVWEKYCSELKRGVPQFEIEEDEMIVWFETHDKCSFTYEPIED